MRRFLTSIIVGAVAAAPVTAQVVDAASANAGEVRVLDKLTGEVTDITLQVGETWAVGYLKVTLSACRYPTGNPNGDAFLALDVLYQDSPTFAGWMLASSPALNAMDHPRYDVWALRCITS
ncbi:DUF2155 domain-containing protein [Yoonia sp. 2307UL14-13]|uniref:DUF2155 domain-containing protein n=1 Tax=Yoonia sp. 2307UL14-13 TaxID=3126506 RepID=UPI0030B4E9D8